MTENEKIEKITSLLGGYNCGGCGFDSCEECAKNIVKGELSADACVPIDSDNLETIKKLLSEN